MQLYLRGQELAEQVGDDEQQLMVLDGLCRSYMISGQVKQGRDMAEQSLVLAERIGEPSRLAEAHGRLGEIFFHLGHWHASREQMEQALALVEYSWDASAQLRGEQYPGELIQLRLGFVLWYLGYADQAQFHTRASMVHAQVVKHPHTLAALHFWSGWLHYLGQEAQLAQAEAEASVELAQHDGFLNWAVHSRAVMAWTLSYQGRIEEALAQVNEALQIRQAINLPPRDPEFLALLAVILGRCGQSGKGLLLLNEALAEIESSGVRFCEPEVYRCKG